MHSGFVIPERGSLLIPTFGTVCNRPVQSIFLGQEQLMLSMAFARGHVLELVRLSLPACVEANDDVTMVLWDGEEIGGSLENLSLRNSDLGPAVSQSLTRERDR